MPRGWCPIIPVRFVGRGGPEHGLKLLYMKVCPPSPAPGLAPPCVDCMSALCAGDWYTQGDWHAQGPSTSCSPASGGQRGLLLPQRPFRRPAWPRAPGRFACCSCASAPPSPFPPPYTVWMYVCGLPCHLHMLTQTHKRGPPSAVQSDVWLGGGDVFCVMWNSMYTCTGNSMCVL